MDSQEVMNPVFGGRCCQPFQLKKVKILKALLVFKTILLLSVCAFIKVIIRHI